MVRMYNNEDTASRNAHLTIFVGIVLLIRILRPKIYKSLAIATFGTTCVSTDMGGPYIAKVYVQKVKPPPTKVAFQNYG